MLDTGLALLARQSFGSDSLLLLLYYACQRVDGHSFKEMIDVESRIGCRPDLHHVNLIRQARSSMPQLMCSTYRLKCYTTDMGTRRMEDVVCILNVPFVLKFGIHVCYGTALTHDSKKVP